jgi:hypothetical protein
MGVQVRLANPEAHSRAGVAGGSRAVRTSGPNVSAEDRPTKQCPDCAEMVLEAARKCRYCGYRFDGVQPAPADEPPEEDMGILGGLLIRRKTRPTTAPQIIKAAGAELEPDELISLFRFVRIDGVDGIIAVTSVRVLFLEAAGRRHRVRFDRPLGEVTATEVARRLTGHRMHVRWADGHVSEILGLKRTELLDLQLLLDPSRP